MATATWEEFLAVIDERNHYLNELMEQTHHIQKLEREIKVLKEKLS